MKPSLPPRITAAIVSARAEMIQNCLAALRSQSLPGSDFEILVVAEYALQFELEPNEAWVAHSPKSISVKRNIALRCAKSPLIAFLDDDCLADRLWLEKGLAYLTAHPESIGVQGRIIVPASTGAENPNAGETKRLMRPLFQTSNIFYRVDPVCSLGGFDERFSFQREDTDLGFSLIESGFSIGYEPEAVVHHPPRQNEYWDLVKTAFRKRYDPLLKKKHPDLFQKHFRIFPGSFQFMLFLWLVVVLSFLFGKSVEIGSVILLFTGAMVLTLKKTGFHWMEPIWFISQIFAYLLAPWVCLFSVAGGWGNFCWRMKNKSPFPLTRIGSGTMAGFSTEAGQ